MLHLLLHADESGSVARELSLRLRHVIYMPAAVVQHPSNHAISVTPELSRQFNDVLGQPFFVRKTEGYLALRRAMLSQCAAGPALGYAKGLPHMFDALAAASGA